MKRQIELLAPAGSLESVKAAYCAGADAVYAGGNRFGARAYAQNLTESELLDAIDYAHLHDRKFYLTVNTLLKEPELEEELYAYLKPLYTAGLEAVIVQDLGVLDFVKQEFPGLAIHASTQMTLTGSGSAAILEKLGASRVVTPRELSLQEIQNIRKETNVEIESFVHGALCYCYSGQCLLSSVIGGRSGNRGRCAQPCRLPYDVVWDGKTVNDALHKYVLSPKDMCTLAILPEIIEAGVNSLKIEGRMKKPEYTAGVVSIYRKYLDRYLQEGKAGYQIKPQDMQILWDLFNRNGFHESYYKQHNGSDMITFQETKFRPGNQKLMEQIQSDYIGRELKKDIHIWAELLLGKPIRLTLCCDNTVVAVEGEIVQEAQKQPVTEETVKKQLKKWGNSPFTAAGCEIELGEGCFVTVGQLNALRRKGQAALTEALLSPYRRTLNRHKNVITSNQREAAPKRQWKLICQVSNREQWDTILENPSVSWIFAEAAAADIQLLSDSHKAGYQVYYVFPDVFRQNAVQYYEQNWKQIGMEDYDGYVIRSLETLSFLKNKTKKPIIFDCNIYAWNQRSRRVNQELGAKRCVLPMELNYRELSRRDCREDIIVAYGYMPVMVTANCIRKNIKDCKAPGQIALRDRYQHLFPVQTYCRFCYNKIYNSQPTVLLDLEQELKKLNLFGVKLDFTIESAPRVRQILETYTKVLAGEKTQNPINDYTRGHFRRGVE